MIFRDRQAAGRRLAGTLMPLAGERPVVIGLARGGVPVAFEVARALDAPLDVFAVRKLGAPGHPELAVGALAEERIGVLASEVAARVEMTQEDLDRVVERESADLERRVLAYWGAAPVSFGGRTTIVVDDGLATGFTRPCGDPSRAARRCRTHDRGGSGRFARGHRAAARGCRPDRLCLGPAAPLRRGAV